MKFSKPFFVAVLCVVGMALYATSFGNAMFWDDDDFILKNQYIQHVQHLPNLFTENVIAGSGLVSDYWRPVLLLVFSAEWHLWGDAPLGWHVVNALFHTANGVLLFLLLLLIMDVYGRADDSVGLGPRSAGRGALNVHARVEIASSVGSLRPRNDKEGEGHGSYRTYMSFFVALLFLVHPVQVEAVAYVNSLGDSLSTFFVFGALVLYAQYLAHRRAWAYAGAVALYPIALMSKETAIILPGLVLLLDALFVIPEATVRAVRRWASGALSRVAPFLVIAGAYVVARITILNFKNSLNLYNQATAYTESMWIRLLTFCKVLWEYFQLLVWPRVLHMERQMDSATSMFEVQVLLGAAVVLVLAAIAVWMWRRGSRLPAFGLLWFLIALAPTSNIAVPINGVLYEHWLYVPLVGMGVFVAGVLLEVLWGAAAGSRMNRTDRANRTDGMSKGEREREVDANRPEGVSRAHMVEVREGARKNRERGRAWTWTLVGVGSAVMAAFGVRSVVRIHEWGDPVRFYTQTLQHAPQSYRIVNNLAMELADRGDLAESIPYYQRAITLDPQNPVALYNLGNTYAALGNLAKAAAQYEQTIATDPSFVYTYRPLIRIYLQAKNTARVAELLTQYARLRGGLEPDLQQVANAIQSRS